MSETTAMLAEAYLERPEQIRPLVDSMLEDAMAAGADPGLPFMRMLAALCGEMEPHQEFFARADFWKAHTVSGYTSQRFVYLPGKTPKTRFQFSVCVELQSRLVWSFVPAVFIADHYRSGDSRVRTHGVRAHWRRGDERARPIDFIVNRALVTNGWPGVLALALLAESLAGCIK